MQDQATKLRTIFHQALALDANADRTAFLDSACEGDAELRARVQVLLDAYGDAGSFLEAPPPELAQMSGTAAATSGPSLLERPGTIIGPYKLLQQIGEGGFGVVYMAEQLEPMRRKVALKIIKPGMDSREVVARFEAERQALALMDHPNIARVFDGGMTASGRPYFVMELVKGIPLTQFCDENRLDTQRRLELFAAVCKAIQHAHQKGVIHRDIKPSNVMVTMHDGEPVPKVIDFGVAKAISLRLTEKTLFTAYGQMIGTPQYMSPEQAEMSGLDIDTRSDIYSLGVLMYELLTGTTPLDIGVIRGLALAELQRMIRESDAPPPSVRLSNSAGLASIAAQRNMEPRKLSAMLRGELDWIVLKALEKNRNRRYETANDLAQDVERYLIREPVLACPPTLTYRLAKTLRRHRGVVLIAGSVLLALTAGLVATFWQYTRAVQQRAAAERARQAARQAEQQAVRQSLRLQKSVSDLTRAERTAAEALADRSDALRRSEALRFAAQSSAAISSDPGLAVLLAIEGARRMPRLAAANNALLASLNACRELRTFRHRPDARVQDAIFSPDESMILGVEAVRIGVWDAASGHLIRCIDPHHRLQNIRATCSPDNRHIAVISRGSATCQAVDGGRQGFTDRVVRIWNARSGDEVAVLRGHGDRVADICFNRDGSRLASASWDGTVRIWNPLTGESIKSLDFGTSVARLVFTPDERMIIAAREEQPVTSLLLWDDEPADSPLVPQVIDPPLHESTAANVGAGTGQRYKTKGDEPIPLVKVWNLESGELISTIGQAGMNGVQRMDALSAGDKHQLLLQTGSRITLWDVATGDLTAECLGDYRDSTGDPGRNRVDFQFQGDRKQLRELCLDPHKAAAYLTGTTISPDGTLAAFVAGRVITVCTTHEPSTSIQFQGHSGDVADASIAFSHDGQRLLSAGDSTVRLWDSSLPPASGNRVSTQMKNRLTEHTGGYAAIPSLAFSPDGTQLATASRDKFARLFDASDGTQIAALLGNAVVDSRTLRAKRGDPQAADHVAASRDQQPSELRRNSLGEARLVRFSPDGSKLVVVSDDPRAFVESNRADQPREALPFTPVRTWDVATGHVLWGAPGNVFTLPESNADDVAGSLAWGFEDAVFTSDGAYVVTLDSHVDRHAILDEDGSNRQNSWRSGLSVSTRQDGDPVAPLLAVRCWDANTGDLVRSIAPDVAGKKCWLSPDGRRATVPDAGGYRVVDPTTGSQVCRLGGDVDIRDIPPTFSPDHRWLVIAASGLHLWNIESGEYVRPFGRRAADAAENDDAGRPASRVESPGEDGAAAARDRRQEQHTILPYLARFTPDSALLVTASTDGSAHVWAMPGGQHVAGFFGHTAKITCLDISPDAAWCVTGSADGTARIWSIHTGVERITLPLGTEVSAVAFDGGGDRIATAAAGIAQVWPLQLLPLAAARTPRDLTSAERLRYEVDRNWRQPPVGRDPVRTWREPLTNETRTPSSE